MASPMSALIDSPVRYDLAESTSPPLDLGDIVDAGVLAKLPLGYGTSRGDADLRELVAADTGIRAEQVLVTVGAVEAMFLIAHVSCAPGDRVLLASPCFPHGRTGPAGLGAEIDAVPLTFGEGYRLPVERLAAALTPRTTLVSLASPQNPSGVRFTEDELRALLAAVEERAPEAVVLVDETYRAATYGDEPIPPSTATLSPRLVTCSSLSKAHGAPGLRLGWLTCTDPDLYERLRDTKFGTTIACPNVDELLAAEVLRRQAEFLAPRARRLREALDELLDWTGHHPVEIVVPDAGALCCLRLPAGETGTFYRRLAERDARVAPGSWFGDADGDRVFRLGFGHLSPADFTEALSRLAAAI